jgi:hypothetical protein
MVKGYDKFGNNGEQMHERHYCHNDYLEKGHTREGIVFGRLSPELGLENGRAIQNKEFRALADNKNVETGKEL